MSSWKHTPIFIRKNRYFCHVLRLKRSKIASKYTLWSTSTCILPTVNIESGLKGFYTVYGGQHSKWCQSERQNQHFRESEDSVFFPKAGVISQRRETGFLFLTVKLIKMTLSPHQSLVSAVRLASKYPSPTPETSL